MYHRCYYIGTVIVIELQFIIRNFNPCGYHFYILSLQQTKSSSVFEYVDTQLVVWMHYLLVLLVQLCNGARRPVALLGIWMHNFEF